MILNFWGVKTPGEIITDYLYKKDISQSKLARMLGDSPQNLGKKIRVGDLSFSLINQISEALQHNFFEDISKEYKKNHLPENVLNEPAEEYIAGRVPSLDLIRQIVKEELNKQK